MRFFSVILLAAIFTGCTPAQPRDKPKSKADDALISQSSKLYLYAPGNRLISFTGAREIDSSGAQTGNMAYPADTGGMFAASLLAHAIAISAIRSHEEDAQAKRADLVLQDYRQAIDDFSFEKLTMDEQRQLKSFRTLSGIKTYSSLPPTEGWIIGAVPAFILSQDQKTLTLVTEVRIAPASNPISTRYEREIVYSVTITPDTSPAEYWLKDNASTLYETGASMYASTLAIALDDATGNLSPIDPNTRTFRFRKGERAVYERGTMLRMECGRLTMLTLRKSIKSLPIDQADYQEHASTECPSTSLAFE